MSGVMNQKTGKGAVTRFRKILEEKGTDIRTRMSTGSFAEIVHRRGEPSDEGDLSQQSHEEWLFVNRNQLEITVLKQVDAALRRIERGTFGVCLECEEPISNKRLEAVPWARYCIPCQERHNALSDASDIVIEEEDL
ncbi:MAG: TraR/DksA family transcriptional regulator [Bryobacterales bacterium]|nr:TraR/DksA family transcriptional regulator [Bryobacterales bacterium]